MEEIENMQVVNLNVIIVEALHEKCQMELTYYLTRISISKASDNDSYCGKNHYEIKVTMTWTYQHYNILIIWGLDSQ